MKDTRLNCGVIGLGRLGFKHAQNLAGRVPRARLVAAADPVPAARDSFRAQFPQADSPGDYHEILRRKDVDAVIIASSTDTHGRIIMESLRAGKYVFCEKPVTLDMAEAEELRKVLGETQGFLMIGFMRRFDSAYRMGKARVDSGELGEPVSMTAISRDPAGPPIEFAKASGGLALDMCVHDIDLARWFLGGEVSRVYAQGGVLMCPELEPIGDIDHAFIEFTFGSGKMAHLEGSRNARYGYDIRTEVICTRGAVFMGGLRQTSCLVLNKNGCLTDVVPEFRTRFDAAYLAEMEAFVEGALSGKPSPVTLEDGIRAVQLCFAVNESLKRRLPVDLK
ncbi:MAG: Gfo/Idh/MocA family oxidoreductase [Spirochaetaceae bacterium]|jgi:scyllo-inositol 2-dehydrogenase (NAD+)|nr:Gfo/Idh/MocA family oxidoreductase [Spirochaetaceae bacterium]